MGSGPRSETSTLRQGRGRVRRRGESRLLNGRLSIVVWAVVVLLLGSCSNAEDPNISAQDPDGAGSAESVGSGGDDGDPSVTGDESGDGGTAGEFVKVDAPGVTDTEIRVGAVTSVGNPAGLPVEDSIAGLEARFAVLNEAGGIHGRDLVLSVQLDDRTLENDLTVTQLISQEDVFAAAPMSPVLFTGAPQLAAEGIPTFGWNTSTEFQGAPNLFGFRGHLCFDCPVPALPWLWNEIDRPRIGILALSGIPQTQDCVEQVELAIDKFGGAEIVYSDPAIALGNTNFAPQVSQMEEAGVQMVASCLDSNAVLAVGEEMLKQDVDASQMLFIGYDPSVIEAFGDELEGAWAMTTFTPFEVDQPSDGLTAFLDAIEESGGPVNEFSLSGWVAADLLIAGLEGAGPDFSRASVIEAINAMTDYSADGIVSEQDWSLIHDEPGPESCVVFSEVVDGALTPRFGEPGRPFSCFEVDTDVLPESPRPSAG